MTDLERAQVIDADPDGSLRVSTTQHDLRIEYRRCHGAQCQVSIPWSEIDRHRGVPLTLEDVQTVILDVANEHGQPPGYLSHLHFAMDVLARLRQKMGGLDYTLLSPLTLETVERIGNEVWAEFKGRTDLSVEARDAAMAAIERMEDRLRQQMGGGHGA